MTEIKKVVLVGAGTIGSYFSPRLYNWMDEGEFYVLSSGQKKERIENHGLMINGLTYKFPIITPEDKSFYADLVIIAVRGTNFTVALKEIANIIGPETIILPALNGVDIEERVGNVYGFEHLLYSYMDMFVNIKNGHYDFDPSKSMVHFGEEINESYSEKVLLVKKLFDKCHIKYKIDRDMKHGIWKKFIETIGSSMTGAVVGVSTGAISRSSHANFIRKNIMQETLLIAQALNVNINKKDLADIETELSKVSNYDNRPLTLQDLDNHRNTDVELYAGAILKLGKKLKVSTPYNEMAYHIIKAFEEKNSGIL
ncbi:2-dehydropantoate 2-reductase [Acetitomaculum ruminis DSM 5522]|uniref:2-dehydropantoate 2-reductase n=1 Tax=Acetitomaculum ruminis DSM 5522 TaxID=1120918 RepID=A0A1I0VU42_9FIRM|nr:2-dehydropantoate 2-reductase [Acetitomaculum ruminis]SFA79822.1 2-dehydropantoate 2-reductase [Acetitomaculum ruminis DSM 5522]